MNSYLDKETLDRLNSIYSINKYTRPNNPKILVHNNIEGTVDAIIIRSLKELTEILLKHELNMERLIMATKADQLNEWELLAEVYIAIIDNLQYAFDISSERMERLLEESRK